ncbi:MAG: hypothetical protein AABX14_01135, partial [Candidatus Aenigmatarchaeota archaeon]
MGFSLKEENPNQKKNIIKDEKMKLTTTTKKFLPVFIMIMALLSPAYAKDFAVENASATLLNVTGAGNIFLVPSGGNVGIGTTVISQILTVAGNANITGGVYATNFFGNGSQLTGIISTNVSILYGTNASNTSQVLPARVSTEGNLMFSVQEGTGTGWTRVSGNIYPTTLSDKVGIGTATPSYSLDVAGNANITQTLLVMGVNVTGRQSSDNTTLQNWINGLSTTQSSDNGTLLALLGQKLNLTGGTLSGSLSGTTGTFANGLNVTAGGLIVSAGNVGIGTTGPGAKLSIYGTSASETAGPHLEIKASADAYPLFSMLNWAHDDERMYFDGYYSSGDKSSDAGSTFGIQKYQDVLRLNYGVAAAGSAVTMSPGIVLTSNGNVGIGTTGPGYKLDVNGTLGVTGDFAVNTDKFKVVASSGYTTILGRMLATSTLAGSTAVYGWNA